MEQFITTKHDTQTKTGQCRITAVTLTVENFDANVETTIGIQESFLLLTKTKNTVY